MTTTEVDALATARALVDAAQDVIAAALSHAAQVTDGGRSVDEHQVHVERVAYLATQVRAAHELVAYAERLAAAGKPDALIESDALVYAAEATHALRSSVEAAWDDFAVACVHQVSLPYLDIFADRAGVPRDKLVVTLAEHGNVASASLPLQLVTAQRMGRCGPGDLVALVGLAGGVSLGIVVVRL